jgi:hypothetical protein
MIRTGNSSSFSWIMSGRVAHSHHEPGHGGHRKTGEAWQGDRAGRQRDPLAGDPQPCGVSRLGQYLVTRLSAGFVGGSHPQGPGQPEWASPTMPAWCDPPDPWVLRSCDLACPKINHLSVVDVHGNSQKLKPVGWGRVLVSGDGACPSPTNRCDPPHSRIR